MNLFYNENANPKDHEIRKIIAGCLNSYKIDDNQSRRRNRIFHSAGLDSLIEKENERNIMER